MSKKRTQLKDNNISSKLLGTNIQDINIEKFRDITNINKQKFNLNGKLNVPILKSITNKFSTDIIFAVTLPDQAIANIDALQECENIIVLNLSNNNINSINSLSKMRQLKFLNMSNNSISSIDPIKSLQNLVNAHFEGNSIKNLSDLKPIQYCENLRSLYLQTLAGNQFNPVCNNPGYRSSVFQILAQLKRLDGIQRNVDLDNGAQLTKKNKKQLKIQLKNNGPFYCNKFPTIMANYNSIAGQGELKKSINDCKNLMSSLQARLKAALIK